MGWKLSEIFAVIRWLIKKLLPVIFLAIFFASDAKSAIST
jgi:hypothetical protein